MSLITIISMQCLKWMNQAILKIGISFKNMEAVSMDISKYLPQGIRQEVRNGVGKGCCFSFQALFITMMNIYKKRVRRMGR